MENDESLRTNGIRIISDRNLVGDVNERLRSELEYHQDEEFLRQWGVALEAEAKVFEHETLTNEPTTTGVYRGHLYAHCNRFLRFTQNFKEKCRLGRAQNLRWGDPPTTVTSVADVAAWNRGTALCCGEHKRKVVCTGAQLESLYRAADESDVGVQGILVTVQNGALVWEGFVDPQHRHTLKKFIIQVR